MVSEFAVLNRMVCKDSRVGHFPKDTRYQYETSLGHIAGSFGMRPLPIGVAFYSYVFLTRVLQRLSGQVLNPRHKILLASIYSTEGMQIARDECRLDFQNIKLGAVSPTSLNDKTVQSPATLLWVTSFQSSRGPMPTVPLQLIEPVSVLCWPQEYARPISRTIIQCQHQVSRLQRLISVAARQCVRRCSSTLL